MHDMKHIPVLLKETLDVLGVFPGGRYVDATLGRAGHSKAIIEHGGSVLGIDRDDDALAEVRNMNISGLEIVKGNHGDLTELAHKRGWEKVDGILLDLGVSSPQLDEAGRGFSFLREGPLDMRMDRSRTLTAADIVNTWSEGELAGIFREFGEERASGRIARNIVSARMRRPFVTTLDLASMVEKCVGAKGSAHHPATRVFQALRMVVNDEMGELKRALEGGVSLLAPGGRFAVITFESLTDRVVKRFFAAHVGKFVSLQQGGEEWSGVLPRANAVTKHAITASEAEKDVNPRSRSAKLRAIEMLKEVA